MTEDRKHLHIIIDEYGNPWGPFESATEAGAWAKRKWPEQEQDMDNHHNLEINGVANGWDIWALRSPDE